jgi:hypothetical protein
MAVDPYTGRISVPDGTSGGMTIVPGRTTKPSTAPIPGAPEYAQPGWRNPNAPIPGAPSYAQPGWVNPNTSTPAVSPGYTPGSYIPGAPEYAQPGWVNPNTPASPPAGGGGSVSRPAPTQLTPAQIEANNAKFFAQLQAAQDAAKAGDPTQLQNFDKFFGISRPAAEYTQEFYFGSSPDGRIDAVNALNIPLEQKVITIAEIKIGNTDSVSNMVGWLERGNLPQQAAIDFMSSPEGKIAIVNELNIPMDQKVKTIAEIKIGNTDSVSNMVGWLERGNQPQQAALDLMNSQDGKISLVNSLDISQDMKRNITAEIMIGNNDSISNMVTWFQGGNPPQAAALAYLNPPPPPPVAVAEPQPEIAAPEAAPVNPEEQNIPDNISEEVINPSSGNPSTDESTDSGLDSSHPGAANNQHDERAEQAMAAATAKRQSSREERLRKIMEMRKPYTSGGGSTGTDAMIAPVITPASQVPPPALP